MFHLFLVVLAVCSTIFALRFTVLLIREEVQARGLAKDPDTRLGEALQKKSTELPEDRTEIKFLRSVRALLVDMKRRCGVPEPRVVFGDYAQEADASLALYTFRPILYLNYDLLLQRKWFEREVIIAWAFGRFRQRGGLLFLSRLLKLAGKALFWPNGFSIRKLDRRIEFGLDDYAADVLGYQAVIDTLNQRIFADPDDYLELIERVHSLRKRHG